MASPRLLATSYSGSGPPTVVAGAQSTFGRQVKSTRKTALDYTISVRDTFREPKGIKPFTHVSEVQYLGEAHMIHHVPATPGPGNYKTTGRESMGKQVLTKNKAPQMYSFSTADRFGYLDRAIKKNATPGPGSYIA
jgi:hypothetical protein